MKACVVVCTLNRAGALERAVISLITQDLGSANFEILIVDNGSSDDTEAVASRLVQQHPCVRYVKEPSLGLSHARNRGVAETSAEFIAFLDDDATATTDWLRRLVETIESNARLGATGGPITVVWPNKRPEWMSRPLEGYYGHCDFGGKARHLKYPDCPFGSNMLIRRQLLVALGGFSKELGVRGDDMMAGEELHFFQRLNRAGYEIQYVPAAQVQHHPTVDRLRVLWILRRGFGHGRSSALLDPGHGDRLNRFPSFLLALRRALGGTLGSCAAVVGFKRKAVLVSRAVHAAYWYGFAAQRLRKARVPAP